MKAVPPLPPPEIDRSRDEFLTLLGHELRGPLAPICNALYLLHQSPDDLSTVLSTLGILERQVYHLVRLVDDLLDMSRLAQGEISLQREELDLRRVAEEVVEGRRRSFEAAGIGLDLRLPEAPLWVRGDEERLAQALRNLLENALKFTDAGGSVSVRLDADARSGQAILTLRDTGIGIEPQRLAHLFDTFAPADRSLARNQGGLGLGLAVAKGLIELHGGTLAATSEGLGKGTQFTLRLARSQAPASKLETPAAASPPRPLRVAIVEDDPDTAESLCLLLRLLHHEVAVARTGERGVEVVREMKPDVVLCDIGLPEMNGFEVAEALKADPATAQSHLVAITGYDQEEDRRHALEAGFEHHLVKPVEPDRLFELLAGYARDLGPRPPIPL